MIKKYFTNSETKKNIAILVSGTGIAQAITLLISPVLTRLYSPNDFAVFALFSSVVAILGVIATARYELAIVLPSEERDAENLLTLAMTISIIVGFLTFIGVFVYDNFLFSAYKSSIFNKWFYLAPVAVFFTGIFSAFNYWSTRKKTFIKNSTSRIATTLTNSSTSAGLGFLSFSYTGLILGSLLGQLVGIIAIGHGIFISLPSLLKRISKKKMKEMMVEYKKFALVNSPHALIDSLQDNGVVFILAYFFLSPVVGFYSFAFRILKAPVGLVGAAFYQVMYQKMSEAKNNGQNVQHLILSVYKKMFLIGFPVFLILFIFSPSIFSFVFGEKWMEAGYIAQILIPWIFFNFLVSPVSGVALIYGKQNQAFFITLIDITVRLIALITGGVQQNYKLSFILISIFDSFLMIFAMIWYYRIPQKYSVKTNE